MGQGWVPIKGPTTEPDMGPGALGNGLEPCFRVDDTLTQLRHRRRTETKP